MKEKNSFKFRAWDKRRKCMIEVTSISFRDGTIQEETRYAVNRKVYLDDVVVMQYTGLKDKNGVEIYEGDVLYVEQQSRGIIDQFIPHKRSVAVRYEAKDTAYVFDEEYGQAIGLYTSPDEIEVIGNIYEHPHLLKEQNK